MNKPLQTALKLNSVYQIAPEATADDLLNDATCLMSVVRDSLAALATSIDCTGESGDITNECGFSQILAGLGYLAEMGCNAASAAHSISITSGKEMQS